MLFLSDEFHSFYNYFQKYFFHMVVALILETNRIITLKNINFSKTASFTKSKINPWKIASLQ